jgi:ABC-type multidrug transport system fused ATPase/permease subunit
VTGAAAVGGTTATSAAASAVALEAGAARASKESKASIPRRADAADWLTLWRLSKPDMPLIFVAFASLLLAASGEVLTPQLQSTTLNMALNGGVRSLGAPIARLTAVGVFTAVATGLRGFIFWILGSRLVARLREALYAAMLAKPQAFHDERAPGELGSRLSSDVIKLGDVLSLNINIVLRQVVQTAGGMFFVWRLHPSLACVLLVGVLARSVCRRRSNAGGSHALCTARLTSRIRTTARAGLLGRVR